MDRPLTSCLSSNQRRALTSEVSVEAKQYVSERTSIERAVRTSSRTRVLRPGTSVRTARPGTSLRAARPGTSLRAAGSHTTSARPHTAAATTSNTKSTSYIGLVNLDKLRTSLEISCIVDRLSYDLTFPLGQKPSIALRNSKKLNRNEYTRLQGTHDRLDRELSKEIAKMDTYKQLVAKDKPQPVVKPNGYPGRPELMKQGGYPGRQDREVTLLFKDQHGRVKQLGFYHKSWGSESKPSPRPQRTIFPPITMTSAPKDRPPLQSREFYQRPASLPKVLNEKSRSTKRSGTASVNEKLLLEGTGFQVFITRHTQGSIWFLTSIRDTCS